MTINYVIIFVLGVLFTASAFFLKHKIDKDQYDGIFTINYKDPMKNLVEIELEKDIFTIEDKGYLLLRVEIDGTRDMLIGRGQDCPYTCEYATEMRRSTEAEKGESDDLQ